MKLGELIGNLSVIIFFANIVLAFVIIFLSRKNPGATWAWVLVLMFIPILGFFLYLFLGQDARHIQTFTKKNDEDEKKLKAHCQKLLSGQSSDINHPALVKDKELIRLHLNNSYSVFTQNNRIQVLKDGEKKFSALLKALESACHHIHMEYYIIRDDDIGRKIRDILAAKAREGVEVRLLYDGMGCIALPKGYAKPILQSGGEVAVFFPPFFPHINVRVNYRNHRKIVVIDGKKAFVGGLNLGDEYLGKSPKYGFWRDTHLMVEGNAVDFLQLRFLSDWEFAAGTGLPLNEKYFPEKELIGKKGVQIVSSGPDTKWDAIRQGYFKMITGAEKSIYIQTAYFVPDDSLTEALKAAALCGVDVRIMIPGKRDHPFVHWASVSYLSDLLDSGVKAYIYDYNRFMHVKAVIVDGRVASVGSANFDLRSFIYNFEVNAVLYDTESASQLMRHFEEDMLNCIELTREMYENRSYLVRFKESVSRLISPLL
ncbi:MAG TPA: cardiolipin synthase [Clostridiales bacterium]|nr:cardiolipin synthase [Clostridiales bacterium]